MIHCYSIQFVKDRRYEIATNHNATYNYFGQIVIAENEHSYIALLFLAFSGKKSSLLSIYQCYSFQTFLVVEYERSKLTFFYLSSLSFSKSSLSSMSLCSLESGYLMIMNHFGKGIQGFNFLMSVPDECISRFSLERYRKCFQQFK